MHLQYVCFLDVASKPAKFFAVVMKLILVLGSVAV